jgi:hypothetical protein
MKRVLHVGCGQRTIANLPAYFKGWGEIRLDIEPAYRPDVVASMTDMRAVPSRSADAVYSSHNLEHLAPHEVPQALTEFRRVLSDDGFAVILVPDLHAAAAAIAAGDPLRMMYDSPTGPVTALDMVYGHSQLVRRSPFMTHRTGFTKALLQESMRPFFSYVVASNYGTFNIAAIGFVREAGSEIERFKEILAHS